MYMRTVLMLGLSLLSACSASSDLQGRDPAEYYAQHPIENTLETRSANIATQFSPRETRLSPSEISSLRHALQDISPAAMEKITIELAAPKSLDNARQEHLRKLLRSFGYHAPVAIVKLDTIGADEVIISASYVAVVPPDCPDWKMSPTTTYSNSTHTNWGCASTVNLGQMVADPHDLVKGHGNRLSSTERAAKAINSYNSGAAAAAPAAASSSGQ